ncbi:MAG: DUF4340 domain-containing protein [Planctomycetes bacterium]|nr:DUF4340 domain-containing protein [Planctomycetota bacterium]
MNRRTSVILSVLAIALTVTSVVLAMREDAAVKAASVSGRLFEFDMGDVTRMEIFEGTATKPKASFYKTPEHLWYVQLEGHEVADSADAEAVENLSAIIAIARERPAKGVTAKEAGLEDDSKVLMLSVESGKKQQTLIIGGTTEDGHTRYVALGQSPDRVLQVHSDLLRILYRKSEDYRNMDLFDLLRAEPNSITLNPGGGVKADRVIKMNLEPEGWYIRKPFDWMVDKEKLDELVRLFKTLRAKKIVADKAGDAAGFGIDDNSPRIIIKAGDVEQEVIFGNTPADHEGVYAMRKGREALYVVSSVISDLLIKGRTEREWANVFRSRALGLMPSEIPARISLQYGDETFVLARGESEKEWKASGSRNFAVEPGAVLKLVEDIRQAQVRSFYSEKKTDSQLKAVGLKKPAVRILCTDLQNRKLLGLNVSPPIGGKSFYATIDDRDRIFELYPQQAVTFVSPPIYYRSRQVTAFNWEDIYSISITDAKGERVYKSITGNNFQLLKPVTRPLTVDATKFTMRVAYMLASFRSFGYLEENVKKLEEFGLDQPQIHVIVTLRSTSDKAKPGEKALDLMIGNESPQYTKALGGKLPVAYGMLTDEKTMLLVNASVIKDLLYDFK